MIIIYLINPQIRKLFNGILLKMILMLWHHYTVCPRYATVRIFPYY
jgi:hypothetical protein